MATDVVGTGQHTYRVDENWARLPQGVGDVSHDIVCDLASDAEPDKSLADVVAPPAGAALGRGMDASEAGGFEHQRQRAEKSLGAGARRQIEAHH